MDVDSLNQDCLEQIFQYSNIVERVNLESVCKKWREASLGSWRYVKSIDLSDPEWQFLLRYAPNKSKRIVRSLLSKCGSFVKRFKDTRLEDPSKLTIIFEAVANRCRNLETVLASNTPITATSVANLAKNCKKIQEFRLGKSIQNCEHQLVKLLNSNPDLIHLHLNKHMIKGRCFLHMSQPIKTLILEQCLDVGAYPLSSWKYVDLNQLETLDVDCSPVLRLQDCIDFLNLFQENNTLRVLRIPNYSRTSVDSIPIEKFHNLQRLIITYNIKVNDAFVDSMVSTCSGLVYLDISGCEMVTDFGLEKLSRLTRLEVLVICSSDYIKGDGFYLLNGLKHLNCSFSAAIEEGNMIKVLENCSRLISLRMEGCGSITNQLLVACIRIVGNRDNNLKLDLNIDCTSMEIDDTFVIPPLLRFLSCEPIPVPVENYL